jgi:hypothetical protein
MDEIKNEHFEADAVPPPQTGELVGSPITDEQVRQFAALFQGYALAYGQYTVSEQEPKTGKNVGPRSTKTGRLTLEHYRVHLDGTGPGLGVVMVMDEHGNVVFCALDSDNYKVGPKEWERRVRELGLPLVVCRTKSGGAHLYLFLAEPVPAKWAREQLARFRDALGLPKKTEIFPKQEARKPGDVGSWINLPYQNANGPTMRYAIHDGQPLEFGEFLQHAEAMRHTRASVEAVITKPWKAPLTVLNDTAQPSSVEDDGSDWFGAPPCLVNIHQKGGFPEGTRNDGMLAVVVYLKKRFGDDWEAHVAKYNELLCKPPLPPAELEETVIKSGRRKDYHYRCKLPPIQDECQSRKCVKQEFGVTDGESEQPDGVIMTNGVPLKALAAKVWKRVAEAGHDQQLYRYGSTMARVSRNKLEALNNDAFWYEISNRCEFGSGPKLLPGAPKPLERFMYNQPRHEAPLRELIGITATPVILPSGRIVAEPGYSELSQYYYAPNADVPRVSHEPTSEEVRSAVALLEEIICDFPFRDQDNGSDKAHALAMIIQPFVRTLIEGSTPLYLINKPKTGTGASKLASVIYLIKTGERFNAQPPLSGGEDELRKRITSALLSGSEFFILDNVTVLKSSSLAALLTNRVWQDRRLGFSQMLNLTVNCTFLATGNNPAMSQEIERRIVDVRLDRSSDRPYDEKVDWRHPDLEEKWIPDNRGRIIHAVLTLARAWFVAGHPYSGKVKASYESWSRVVGGILEFAGVRGFLETPAERLVAAYEDEEESLEMAIVKRLLVRTLDGALKPDQVLLARNVFEQVMTGGIDLGKDFKPGAMDDAQLRQFSKDILHPMADKTYCVQSQYDPMEPDGKFWEVRVKLERVGDRGGRAA